MFAVGTRDREQASGGVTALFWFGCLIKSVAQCSPGTQRTQLWSLPSMRDVDPRDGEGDARSLQHSHPSSGQGFGAFRVLTMSPAGARLTAALPTSVHSCQRRLP